MSIQEELIKINRTFKKLHGDFKRLEAEKSSVDTQCASEVNAAGARILQRRNTLVQLRDDVLKYYRIAKDNSEKDLVKNKLIGSLVSSQ